jgi:hypothetical protein
MTFWPMLIRNVPGGHEWINHAGFGVIAAREFHPIVLALASKLVEWSVSRRPPMLLIFALHASFAIEKPHRRIGLTEATFGGSIPEYLQLGDRQRNAW